MRTNRDLVLECIKQVREEKPDIEHTIFYDRLEKDDNFSLMMGFVTIFFYRNPSALHKFTEILLMLALKDEIKE